jgi:phosphoglycerate dehydrogenase-like enzyme
VSKRFRVGVTRDIRAADGGLVFGDIGLEALEQDPAVEWEFLAEDTCELRPEQVRGYDALFVFSPSVTAASLSDADRLTLLARHGVGLDNVDLGACNAHGVLVTVTPDGVRRPMAAGTLAFLLALAHRLPARDRLTRAGRWQDGRFGEIGEGLTGRTLGVVGFGNIGREILALAEPFGLRRLAHTPRLTAAEAARAGVECVDLETLLRSSDFVCLTCPLTEETYHLIDEERLALMKPSAYLVNIARGALVDQPALTDALREGRLRGAALDVFEQEPVDPDDPILALDNVILAPHAIGYTDEIFRGCVASICESILAVASGRIPRHVANGAVLEHPRVAEKLRLYAERGAAG